MRKMKRNRVAIAEHVIVVIAIIYFVRKVYALGFQGLKQLIFSYVIRGLKVIPGVKGEIEKEQKKMLDTIGDIVRNKELDAIGERYRALPEKGLPMATVLEQMKEMRGQFY